MAAESGTLPELSPDLVSADSRGQNLLSPDTFELDSSGKRAGTWRSAQHSNNISYQFSASEGELSIVRTGVEPWAQVFLSLDARPHAGKTLEFSAELAGDFTLEYGEPFEPSGLGVEVKAVHENLRLRMMGPQTFTSSTDWDITAGSYEWTPLSVRFGVPENATSLQLSIKMTMGGELRARNPRLWLVEE